MKRIRADVPVGTALPRLAPPRFGARLSVVALVGTLLAGGIVALPGVASLSGSGTGAQAPPPSTATLQHTAERAYGKLPLRFEANRGQTDSRVRFMARGSGYTLFLTPRESVLSLQKALPHAAGAKTPGTNGRSVAKSAVATVRMRLEGASAHPRIEGLSRLPGASNYLMGRNPRNWHMGVPGYAQVRYRDVYPGVGLVYYGRQGRLEYDFRVAPGANAGAIAFAISGGRGLTLDRSGNLLIATAAGAVRELRPVVYQSVAGHRRAVAGRYVLKGGGRVGFALGRYDHRRALVIDPALAYSTYLGGGSGGNFSSVVAVDSSGAAYVAGATSAVDFPTTTGALQRTRRGDPAAIFAQDAFVTKLSPAGDALVYSTYLGGNGDGDRGGNDTAQSIALDSSGRAYVTGETKSSDFPTTATAFQKTKASPADGYSTDAFVSVLKADGSGLDYSSFLGGSTDSSGKSIAVDGSGRAYVTGYTLDSDFPNKAPSPAMPLQASPGDPTGAGDVFVAKLNPDASSGPGSLVYSTYLGGDDFEEGTGIAVDATGNTYVAGDTYSTNFPTQNPFQSAATGNGDVFVAKLNPTGSALAYSTYLGGSDFEGGAGIALDPGGDAYLTGSTRSTDFPVTSGAFQTTHAGNPPVDNNTDAFVTKLAPDGHSLAYSTYLGGPNGDAGAGIAVTASGTAYVGGDADKPPVIEAPGSFPTVDPVAPAATNGDAFVSAVKPDGSGLSFSSYLGGGGQDQVGGYQSGGGVAVDGAGSVYLAGTAVSTDFPTLHAFQPQNFGRGVGGDNPEAFVVKLAPVDAAAPLVTGLSGHRSGPAGTSLVITGHGFTGASAVRFGDVAASTFTVDSDARITATAPPGPSGPVAVTVSTPQGTSPPNPIARFAYAQGTWDLTGSLRVPRRSGQTATLLSDGRALVTGGLSQSNDVLAATELYDPSSDKWRTTESMETARQGFTATLLGDGRVLVAGGRDRNYSPLASAEVYDPASGWSPTGSLALGRVDQSATLLAKGRVLVVGGTDANYQPIASAELYDPATGKWSPAGSLHDARDHPTATLLANGKVLVVGGNGARRALASAELYDPATNSWATTGSPGVGRFAHTATRLSDGRVLVAGGADRSFHSLVSSEVYDPASGDFTPVAAMAKPRGGAAAALLSDGRVLVAGGTEANSVHNTAELYDPATGRWGSAGVMNRYRGGEFDAAEVFALPLASGRVLVGGDSQSSGATTELFTPASPSTAPAPAGGATPPSSSQAPAGSTTHGPGRPVISGLRAIPPRFVIGSLLPRLARAARVGTMIHFTLSERAAVRLSFALRHSGRRVGHRCRAASFLLRHRPRCRRYVTVLPSVRVARARAGANRVRFQGRLSRTRTLRPGHYRLTATATDAAGNRSKPTRTSLTAVRRRAPRVDSRPGLHGTAGYTG